MHEKKENEKTKNREQDKLCTQNKSANSSQLNNKSQSNIGSERALEHWIPMWRLTDSCMVLRLYQGAVCDFLCQCKTGRGSSLIQCVWVLL